MLESKLHCIKFRVGNGFIVHSMMPKIDKSGTLVKCAIGWSNTIPTPLDCMVLKSLKQ